MNTLQLIFDSIEKDLKRAHILISGQQDLVKERVSIDLFRLREAVRDVAVEKGLKAQHIDPVYLTPDETREIRDEWMVEMWERGECP